MERENEGKERLPGLLRSYRDHKQIGYKHEVVFVVGGAVRKAGAEDGAGVLRLRVEREEHVPDRDHHFPREDTVVDHRGLNTESSRSDLIYETRI
ncbi:hypothetical protein AAHA92_01085 [Salvia divinorum]|uniref:Uncharacterized protein n=1 Tax=Salvia divinorum TaxID=28513 RepID=A0ABD1ILS4_SALDI